MTTLIYQHRWRASSHESYEAETFVAPAALEAACRSKSPDAILTDIMMGEDNGFGIAGSLRSIDPSTAWNFMTACRRRATRWMPCDSTKVSLPV